MEEKSESTKIAREDLLQTQVLHLKLQVLGLGRRELVRELQSNEELTAKTQQELLENKKKLEEKYKVNLDSMQMDQDGNLIPK